MITRIIDNWPPAKLLSPLTQVLGDPRALSPLQTLYISLTILPLLFQGLGDSGSTTFTNFQYLALHLQPLGLGLWCTWYEKKGALPPLLVLRVSLETEHPDEKLIRWITKLRLTIVQNSGKHPSVFRGARESEAEERVGRNFRGSHPPTQQRIWGHLVHTRLASHYPLAGLAPSSQKVKDTEGTKPVVTSTVRLYM